MGLDKFPEKYKQRVKGFNKDFIKDVLDTCKRIDEKDGKAFPLRIYKSVAKRWKYVYRYKITLVLNYFEYLGLLKARLEPIEEYKERMEKYSGLYHRGGRRKYFSFRSDSVPSNHLGEVTPYLKLSYRELGEGDKWPQIEDYPV